MNNYYKDLNDLQDILRVFSKLRKKYPSAKVYSLSYSTSINKIALGYYKFTSNTSSIKEDDIITSDMFEGLEDKEGYSPIILIG